MIRLPRLLLAALATLAVLGAGASAVFADHVPLNLRYHRISLSNGRILKDVTLNSLNRETDLIYVLEDHRLKPYPRALFPGFVSDRVDTLAAESPAAPAPRETASAAPAAARPEAPPNAADLAAAREQALLDAVAVKAREAALRHLRYKLKTGSGYTTVTDTDLDLNPPEAISGWTHRYRVQGDGYYSYYESVGGAFHRRSRGIEIVLEASSPQRVKVLEVNTSWGSLLN